MRVKILSAIFVCFAVIGCKSHWGTVPVCDGKLYVEVYRDFHPDVHKDYLTDHAGFDMYITRFDSEHHSISYVCNGDSICISEWEMSNDITKGFELVSERYFKIDDLKSGKVSKYE